MYIKPIFILRVCELPLLWTLHSIHGLFFKMYKGGGVTSLDGIKRWYKEVAVASFVDTNKGAP
jgi:hypothetical protein